MYCDVNLLPTITSLQMEALERALAEERILTAQARRGVCAFRPGRDPLLR